MPPNIPFTKAEDLRLIKLVKRNPLLYNSDEVLHSGSADREKVWKHIADKLNKPVQHCKTRWLSIRDNMRRRVTIRSSLDSKSDTKYKYEDELQFLLPFYKFKQPHGFKFSETSIEFVTEDDTDTETAEPIFIESNNYEMEEEDVKPNIHNEFLDSEDNAFTSNDCEGSTVSGAKKNAIGVFLEAVDSTLRTLNPYYLNLAKTKIFQVVQDCELQQIINKGEQPSA